MKLCIAGVRGHYGYVFEELDQLPDVRITGICSGCADDLSPLSERCKAAGQQPAVYDDYLRMLDEQSPDAVAINGPFEQHARMSIAALERGIHVFCEKPLALTLDDLQRLEEVYARTQGVFLMAMAGLRYDPAFRTAWNAVKAGAVGAVKLIHAQKSYKLGERPDFYRSRQTYGGTIPWVGSHAIDWILWFSGSEFESVSAGHTAEDNFGHGDLEIAAQCRFWLKNGVQASADIDFLRPAAAPTHGDDRIRVVGIGGIIEVAGDRVRLIDADGERELSIKSYGGIFRDFVRQVEGKRPALVSAQESFALTRACLLARESADTGAVVRFSE